MTESDHELRAAMVAYQGGDVEAFARVYAALAHPLRGYLRSLCRDATLADDLVQEAFLQIHRSRHTYRADHPVQPWAFGVAHHVFLMHRRSSARRVRREHDGAVEDPDSPERRTTEQTYVERDRVRRALRDLTADKRDAVVMHHVLGFRFSEIARRFGIRADAAKVRASRGMAALRALLSHDQETDK